MNIVNEIISIIAEITGKVETEIDIKLSLSEMGCSSVDVVSIVVELEERFSIEFDDADLIKNNFEYITDIVTLVKSKIV